jgi:hypothetical protein
MVVSGPEPQTAIALADHVLAMENGPARFLVKD